MPGRKYSNGGDYRYGFNGKENDKDAGEGVQDYGMRIYDARVGKFLSTDPMTPEYPMLTPYQFGSNRPIDGVDQDGLEWKPVTGADGNVTDYTWSGFNADGSAPEGTKPGGSIVKDGVTYTFGSTSISANPATGYEGFHAGSFSVDDGTNVTMTAAIFGNSASYSFTELNEDGRPLDIFSSGYLGNAAGASGANIAAALDRKYLIYALENRPPISSGDAIDGDGLGLFDWLGPEEIKLGAGLLKAGATIAIKATGKFVLKKSLAALGAAVLKKDLKKDVIKSSKGLLKEAELPVRGKIRFIPKRSDIAKGSLLKKNGGYVDRFGNVWKKGPSRTAGEAFEWDVQLSRRGKALIGHLSNDAKKAHVNVSKKGIVTH